MNIQKIKKDQLPEQLTEEQQIIEQDEVTVLKVKTHVRAGGKEAPCCGAIDPGTEQ